MRLRCPSQRNEFHRVKLTVGAKDGGIGADLHLLISFADKIQVMENLQDDSLNLFVGKFLQCNLHRRVDVFLFVKKCKR